MCNESEVLFHWKGLNLEKKIKQKVILLHRSLNFYKLRIEFWVKFGIMLQYNGSELGKKSISKRMQVCPK